MLKSMTGFGKAICESASKKFTIEIKSLNSKQLDVSIRISNVYKEKEIELRNEIAKQLQRGKIELFIYYEITCSENNNLINKEIVKNYYHQLKSIAKDLKIEHSGELLPVIMRLPDVLQKESKELNDDEWKIIKDSVIDTIKDVDNFRIQEGAALEKDIVNRIELILEYLSKIGKYDSGRINKIKNRIRQNMSKFIEDISFDKNRFEQELIYYIEKLDITEEKVRLTNHCNYFLETINEKKPTGKKLGFISQEIGREINTLGSKANDADIQRLVVQMKDELEKIKEQLLNVL